MNSLVKLPKQLRVIKLLCKLRVYQFHLPVKFRLSVSCEDTSYSQAPEQELLRSEDRHSVPCLTAIQFPKLVSDQNPLLWQ
jgi:hypothetical protein